jgi:hypothetical protein
MPLFSIIAVHYQGANSHEVFLRGIHSITAQTFTDYELLCYHDGPLLEPNLQMPCPVICSEQRYNDWGHSLRDLGMRRATGDYIVHFNVDNVLYPRALARIAHEIARPCRVFHEVTQQPLDTNDIIIFPILMFGLQRIRERMYQFKDDPPFYEILTGNPPIEQNIDCMQLVMKRQLWLKEGGWRDKRGGSDGVLYQDFCSKYGYRTVGPVIGEHH